MTTTKMQTNQRPDIRVIGLDLDGTLFTDAKTITPRALAAIRAAAQKGVAVLPATGRVFSGLPENLLSVPGVDYALTSNGATVVELATGKPVIFQPLSRASAKTVIDTLAGFDCICDLFIGSKGYTPAETYDRLPQYAHPTLCTYIQSFCRDYPTAAAMIEAFPEKVEKVSAIFRDIAERDAAWQAVAAACPCEISASYPNNMEISAPGVTKGTALVALAKKLGYDAENVMACGDSGNDLAMIRAAGLGVAMANAMPEILAAADYITLSNEQDGVAAAIEKFVL